MNEKNLMNDKIVAGKLKGVSFVNPECQGMVVLWIHRGEYGLKHTTIHVNLLHFCLLKNNEKKRYFGFHLPYPTTCKPEYSPFVLYLVILLAAHLRFHYVMVLSLSFFHEAKLQVICFSVWGQVVANLKGKTSWDRFNCWS